MKMSSGWVIKRGLSRKRKTPSKEACGQWLGGTPPTHTHALAWGDLCIYTEPPWPALSVLKEDLLGWVPQESQRALAGVQAHSEDRALLQVLSLPS